MFNLVASVPLMEGIVFTRFHYILFGQKPQLGPHHKHCFSPQSTRARTHSPEPPTPMLWLFRARAWPNSGWSAPSLSETWGIILFNLNNMELNCNLLYNNTLFYIVWNWNIVFYSFLPVQVEIKQMNHISVQRLVVSTTDGNWSISLDIIYIYIYI